MVYLSKYPIVKDKIRTFQKFLWKDMTDAFLHTDPNDTDGDGDLESYYNATKLDVFCLSSRSQWDIPVEIDGNLFHFLSSHPTPPVFEDSTAKGCPSDTLADWNGLCNHNEICFWADYIYGFDAKLMTREGSLRDFCHSNVSLFSCWSITSWNL
jgi:hypothetical protein